LKHPFYVYSMTRICYWEGGGCDDQFIVDYHRLSVWKYRIWHALMDSWTYCTRNILLLIHMSKSKEKQKYVKENGYWLVR